MNFYDPIYPGRCAKCPLRFTPGLVRRIKHKDYEATEILLREFAKEINGYATRVVYDDRGNPMRIVDEAVAREMEGKLLKAVYGSDLIELKHDAAKAVASKRKKSRRKRRAYRHR